MPDLERKTISATESPALFNASPYVTRWMLWRRFKHNDDISAEQTNRMFWGKELQPLLLKKAAADLKLEVQPNDGDTYQRHNGYLIGCTRDAEIYDPVRGWGSLEMKCCFDYGVWMREWGGGDRIPRHYEIQLQHQMLVGDGKEAHTWGIIAVWCCGDMFYFERKPLPVFMRELGTAVGEFWISIEKNQEPDPFGSPVEYPLLAKLFDPEPGAILEMPDNFKLSEIARLYKDFYENRRFYDKGASSARLALITAAAPNYETLRLAGDIFVHLKKDKRGAIHLKVDVPDDLPDELMDASEGIS